MPERDWPPDVQAALRAGTLVQIEAVDGTPALLNVSDKEVLIQTWGILLPGMDISRQSLRKPQTIVELEDQRVFQALDQAGRYTPAKERWLRSHYPTIWDHLDEA